MIHVNSIMESVRAILAADPPLSGFTIEVGFQLNRDAVKLPWIGIWPMGLEVNPYQIQAGVVSAWKGKVVLGISHQAYSEIDGESVPELMIQQQKVLTAVASNPQLDGSVLMISDEAIDASLVEGDEVLKPQYLTNLITLIYDVQGS